MPLHAPPPAKPHKGEYHLDSRPERKTTHHIFNADHFNLRDAAVCRATISVLVSAIGFGLTRTADLKLLGISPENLSGNRGLLPHAVATASSRSLAYPRYRCDRNYPPAAWLNSSLACSRYSLICSSPSGFTSRLAELKQRCFRECHDFRDQRGHADRRGCCL